MRAAANKLGGKAVKVGALGERRLSGAKLTQRQMEGGRGGPWRGAGHRHGSSGGVLLPPFSGRCLKRCVLVG